MQQEVITTQFAGRRTFVSILIPDLPLQVERQRDPLLTSLLVADTSQGRVFAASLDVLQSDVEQGMSLYKARQRVPFAQVIEADELAYLSRHEAVFTAVSIMAERIETVALGEFLLEWEAYRDFEGSGYSTQVEVLFDAARSACGLEVQIGVATHRFTAEQAARRISDDGIFVVRPGSDARFLAQLPISSLPNAPADLLVRLSNFGVHSLGQLAALPKAAFVRQFGGATAPLYDLARGRDPRPLNPNTPPLRFVAERRFGEPVEQASIVLHAARALAQSIGKRLSERGYQAEAVKVAITFANGSRSDTTRGLKPPSADSSRLSWFVGQLVEAQSLEQPVSHIALIAYPVRPWHEGARQLSLLEAAHEAKRNRLEEALRVLKRRFGERCVKSGNGLEPPEPILAQVQTTSDGTPSIVGEREHRRRIAYIEEFWREESGWWDRPARRDYYRVVLEDGSHCNLFFDCVSEAWYVDRSWYVLRAA